MPKAFVTGANGFIGSHLVRELLNRGYDVNCLVRHTSDISSLRGLPVALYIGDMKEPESLVAPIQDVDYVFHLAAELMVTSRNAFEETNTQGTINLMEAAEKHIGKKLKRFLLVSSQAAVGPGEDEKPLDETAELKPVSWYGTSKKKAEEAAKSFADRLPLTAVRPPAVYGDRETDISQTYDIVEKRLQPKLGIKKKFLVMVHVSDLVRAFVDAAESNNSLNKTYFLTHPEVLTTKDVIKITAKAMDKPWGIMFPVPLILIRIAAPFTELIYHFTRNRPKMTRDKAREVSQRFWVATPFRAKRDFGWEAKLDLLEGMKLTIAAFRAEKKVIRDMAMEKGFMLWLKFALVALLLGAILETISRLGHYYEFHPGWGVFVAVIGFFGLLYGTVGMLFRKATDLVQFLIGFSLIAAAEILNYLNKIPKLKWEFAPGWPFGITSTILRIIIVGITGGLFILLTNYLMRLLYKRRLRMG